MSAQGSTAPSAKPHYRLHADGTASAPWMQGLRGQVVYLPQGHPSGLGGRCVYVNRQGRMKLEPSPAREQLA